MTQSTPPYKEVRAAYDKEIITVYQAYNRDIAVAAVREQKLDACNQYRARMTWIKPSFLWAMYRSGWSYKDVNQAHILAIDMTRVGFEELLRMATVNGHDQTSPSGSSAVRVQWDPERDVLNQKLPYRSIQIGIGREVVERWIKEWIVEIRDITPDVRRWKGMLDLLREDGGAALGDVVKELPAERRYELPENLVWITQ